MCHYKVSPISDCIQKLYSMLNESVCNIFLKIQFWGHKFALLYTMTKHCTYNLFSQNLNIETPHSTFIFLSL